MRLGFLTGDLTHRHGWGHYSLSLIQALHRAGVPITVVAAHNSPDVEDIKVHKLLPVPEEGRLVFRMAVSSPQVQKLLRDCDLIHCTIEPYAPLAAWVAGSRPLVITGHGSYVRLPVERRWPIGVLYRSAFQRALLVCVSHYTAKVAQGVMPGVRTAVVNNGVDVERFENLREKVAGARRASPLQESLLERKGKGPTVLSVGAVKARKGTLELVQAMAEVRQQIPTVQCALIGSLKAEPEYVARVEAAIEKLDLKDCVHLLGHVPETTLLDWYGVADVFVVPSMNDGAKFEGYGLVYLEASAAGLPVIGTTDNGAEDAIDDGVTGLLIPQAQVATQLPEAIIHLLKDAELAAKMGAAGREKARLQTWDAVAQQMIDLYHQALRHPHSG